MTTYPLAKNGVFLTIQGEGHWIGWPMVFIRLAGCSIGCPGCDTDYRLHERSTADEIVGRCDAVKAGTACHTAWITGGEPTDHDLTDLLVKLRQRGYCTILATAGHREVGSTFITHLSVSPHDPGKWVQRQADEVKLCDRVNGFRLADFAHMLPEAGRGSCCYVSPLVDREGSVDAESLRDCMAWCYERPLWRLNVQAHKLWGIA